MNEDPNPDNGETGGDDSTQEEQNPYADLDTSNPEPAWKSGDDPRSGESDNEDKSTS